MFVLLMGCGGVLEDGGRIIVPVETRVRDIFKPELCFKPNF
jgi:hypothetical protein